MQNRWHHPTHLHSPELGEEKRVAWLELFYDLIYVAAIIQLGNALSENVGWLGFLGFFALMTPIWFTWTGFTFFSNRFTVDDFLHRTIVFLQMLFVGGVAVSAPRVFDGETTGFALAYAGARLMLVVMYARAWLQTGDAREMTKRYSIGFAIGAVLWGASAFVPSPWVYVMWGVAMAVDLGTPLGKAAREVLGRYPPDLPHMAERYGLLTIIVLGESFVKVLSAISEKGLSLQYATMGGLALGITCFLWWLYFDDIGGSRVKPRMMSTLVWIYSHLPLTVSIVAVGVAIKKAVFFDPFEVATAKYRWLLCGTLALALLSTAALDWVTERRQSEVRDEYRFRIRVGSALVVLLMASIGGLPGSVFVAIVTGVCFLQVIVDLLMSPLTADPHEIHHAGPAYQPSLDRDGKSDDSAEGEERRFRDVSEAVRKGTPSEMRRDLYFHFMEGSWTQLLGAMALFYVLSNVVFGGLFLLEPESVSGLRPNDFVAAFSFSVQTMSTIGYGAMSPATPYGHLLVTIEAAYGLLSVALATGVIFAKLARPSASVVFSRKIVVTEREGKQTLMMRVGNARGNDVTEARCHLAILFDEVSDEGHRMRRIHDLELVRDTTPIFALSWSVMHVIDESSPLWGIPPDEVKDRVVSVIATLQGYDGTYAQTTHARKIWRSDDLVFGERFVDVISSLPDGRLMVDYNVFHDTVPDAEQT